MTTEWELDNGRIKVVEDASTASLVIIARDLKDRAAKAAALREVLAKLEA